MSTTVRNETLGHVTAISAHLPEWSVEVIPNIDNDHRHDRFEMVHDAGARVYIGTITYGPDKGKLHATMSAPKFWYGDSQDQVRQGYAESDVYVNVDRYKNDNRINRFRIGINMNPTRPSEVLGRNINKRLLAHAVSYHAEAMAAVAEHRARLDVRTSTLAELAASVPGVKPGRDGDFSDADYNRGEVQTDGTVRIERLVLTKDQAIAVLRIVAGQS